MLFGLSLSADVCVPFRASGQMWIENYNVTMITTQAAKKIRRKIMLTPLYRLRTVIIRAVLPSRRVTEQNGGGLECTHACLASRFARTLLACKHHYVLQFAHGNCYASVTAESAAFSR